MKLGMHLRELSRLRLGVAASALLACLVTVWTVAEISLFPPKLTPRSFEIATAVTQVVVDTPESSILDLRQGTYDIQALKNRAVLVGTIVASAPVRTHIARRAGVPADALQIVTPRTPAQPRARAEAGRKKKGARDLLRSTDQYRLDVQANPTVPVLEFLAQAPTSGASQKLANAAVDGVRDYLRDIGQAQGTPQDKQVAIRQLGRAHGTVLNKGVGVQVALLTFLVVFAASCLAVSAIARVRRGWLSETSPAPAEPGQAWSS